MGGCLAVLHEALVCCFTTARRIGEPSDEARLGDRRYLGFGIGGVVK
jgi:hypothetical protein